MASVPYQPTDGVAGTVPMTPPEVPGAWPCSGASRELCYVVEVLGISTPQRGEGSPTFPSACWRAWPQDLETGKHSVTETCRYTPGVRTDRGARVAALRSVDVSFLEMLSTSL